MFRFLFLCVWIFSSSAQAGLIVEEWHLFAIAGGQNGDVVDISELDTPAMPFETTDLAVASSSSATVEYDFYEASDHTVFGLDYRLEIDGSKDGGATVFGDIFFTVSDYSLFEFDALMELFGFADMFYFDIRVRNLTLSGGTRGFVFHNFQYSSFVEDENFVAEGDKGNEISINNGFNPGVLIPDDLYLMQYNFNIAQHSEKDSAYSTGNMSFTVTDHPDPSSIPKDPPNVLSVPEPSPLHLMLPALLMFGARGFLMSNRNHSIAANMV